MTKRRYATPESKERELVMHKLKRLHASADRLRCDELIQREGLDPRFDDVLTILDEVIERVPETTRILEAAA